jgi:NADH-quinone oxidoreductase subunit M
MIPFLSFVVWTPAAGAVALLPVAPQRERLIRWIATLAVAASLAASWSLWFMYDPRGTEWQFTEKLDWMPSIGASYSVGLDGLSLMLLLLTTMLGFVAVLYSWKGTTARAKRYYIALLLLHTGTLGAFVALDFLLFLAFWVLALAATCDLFRVSGCERRIAIRLAVSAAAAGVLLCTGVLALYIAGHSMTGVYSFDLRTFQGLALPSSLQTGVFLAFFVAFAITAGLFPFHPWLRDAVTDAPAVVSVVVLGAVLKLGTYGFLRVSLPMLPDASRALAPLMIGSCLIGIAYGALLAFAQRNWTRTVAYSSISYMSLAVLGVFVLTPSGLTGSIAQQINHGISIGALLLIAGIAGDRGRTREVAQYGGLRRVMPAFAVVYLLMTLALVGVPALGGFVSARLILRGTAQVSLAPAIVAAAGILLAGGCMLWLYARTMLGATRAPAAASLRDLTVREILLFVPLAAIAIGVGLRPDVVLGRIDTSVARVVMRVSPEYASEVADCLKPQTLPTPEQTGLPAGMVMGAPCADGSAPKK